MAKATTLVRRKPWISALIALLVAIALTAAGVTAASAASSNYSGNNAQRAAYYAQHALRQFRAAPNGTAYYVTCYGSYRSGPVVAGHKPIKVVCYLTPHN